MVILVLPLLAGLLLGWFHQRPLLNWFSAALGVLLGLVLLWSILSLIDLLGEIIIADLPALTRIDLILIGMILPLLTILGFGSTRWVRMEASDLRLNDDVPHVLIEPKPWRRLKNAWSERRVPLLSKGLEVAQAVPRTRLLFPRYAEARGPDSLSQALMKHLKEVRENNRQTVHSLRHSLKDGLRNTGAPNDLQNAILGHELSRKVHGTYGSGFSSDRLRDALKPALEE